MNTTAKLFLGLLLLVLAGIGGYLSARLFVEPTEEPALLDQAAAPLAPEDVLASRREPVLPEGTGTSTTEQLPEAADSRWALLNREAIALLDEGRFEEAIELFEVCLTGMPSEAIFERNLAEALVRQALRDHRLMHPCEHCIGMLEEAIELAPEREDLPLLLERWRAEAAAESGFWRESSLHFDLAYDGSRDELLWGSHRILNELEGVYMDLAELFGHSPVEEGAPRISVVLYRRESFGALTNLGDWAGGAFDGTVRIPVEDFALEESGMKRVLRHELVHAFNRVVGGGNVPGWLNEGLAQWLEFERDATLAVARRDLAGQPLFPLERLQGSLASWDDEDQIVLAYSQSLLLCEHIAQHYGERVLFQLVEGCAAGIGPAESFEQLTRVTLELALADLADEL